MTGQFDVSLLIISTCRSGTANFPTSLRIRNSKNMTERLLDLT